MQSSSRSVHLINPIVRRWQREATDDPDAFWARAAEALPWFRKWDQVFDWQPPTFRWFIGGQTNIAHNCLDQHVKAGRGGQAAVDGISLADLQQTTDALLRSGATINEINASIIAAAVRPPTSQAHCGIWDSRSRPLPTTPFTRKRG